MSRGLCALVSTPQACPLLCGVFLHLSQLSELILCVVGLVCTCLGSPGLPSASQGLCSLLSAPCVCPSCCRVCVHFCPCACPPCCRVCVSLFCLTSLPSLLRDLCVPLSGPLACPLCHEGCVHCPSSYASLSLSLHPGLPFALRGLFALQGFVWHATLGPLSVPEGLYVLERLICLPTLSSLSPPSSWGTVFELLLG